jgi:hypothetical protein
VGWLYNAGWLWPKEQWAAFECYDKWNLDQAIWLVGSHIWGLLFWTEQLFGFDEMTFFLTVGYTQRMSV